MKYHWRKYVWLVAILFIATLGFAQTTGTLKGKVVDDKGQPLPGVTLEVSSPALQGTRVAQSDVNGVFRFPVLPPGSYTLKATMEGFAELEQRDVKVGLDRTVTLTVQMQPAFEEKITVTGESPVIDITSTTTGANFPEELIEDLPSGRTYQDLAFLAPGAVDGGLGDNPSIMGSSSAENRYLIDGMDTTDAAFGTTGTDVTYNFIQEMEVKSGGYDAEYGGALGGVVNMITKSGSNEFHGDVFGYFTDDSFTASGKKVETGGSSLESWSKYDVGADIGGKIIEDKLWYFVAYNPNWYKQTRKNDIHDLEGNYVTTNTVEPEKNGDYLAAKLTWQVNPNNSLIGTIIADPTDYPGDYYTSFYAPESISGIPTNMEYSNSETGGFNYGLIWNSILSPSLLLEAKLSHFETSENFSPILDAPHYEDGTTDGRWTNGVGQRVRFGGPGFQSINGDRWRDQLKLSLSWFYGNHEVKGGIQYFQNRYDDVAGVVGSSEETCIPLAEGAVTYDSQIGEYVLVEPNCDSDGDGELDGWLAPARRGNRWRLRNWGYYNSNYKQDSSGKTEEWSLFLQDNWKVTPYFTLKVGVRADSTKITGDSSNLLTGRKIDLGLSDQIAPRIGFIWDYAQNGRSKLFGHYGRFYESIPLDINVRAFGNENYDFYFYYYPENGELPSMENPGTLFYIYRFGGGTMADPGLEGQYLEEIVLGTEYEVMPNLAVGLKGIWRELGQVIEDISYDGGFTYFITNPGGCSTVNPVNNTDLGETVCFPEPERKYRGVELSVNKRFSNNWQLYASLLWSKNEGNYGGLFRQDNGQLDPNITSLYDLPDLLNNAYGLLPNDRKWQFKSYGSYRFNFGLTTGFYFQWMSGTPISKLGAHSTYGPNERFVTPRGSAGRTPSWYALDLHLAYPFKITDTMELSLMADVFNVTNAQKAIAVDQEWTFCDETENCADVQTNPYWGEPSAYQTPRAYRLAVKFAW